MDTENKHCIDCQCRTCIFKMFQGDSTDCWNCEGCNENQGDLKQTSCKKHKSWNDLKDAK